MNIFKVFESTRYRSIIYLTYLFAEKDGLTMAHYRWALMPEHDKIKSPTIIKDIKKLFKNYFDSEKSDFYSSKTITRNCFKSKTNLSNYLTRLADEKLYNILEKNPDGELQKYKLSEHGQLQFIRWALIDYVNRMPLDVAKRELNMYMVAEVKAIKEILEELMEKNK